MVRLISDSAETFQGSQHLPEPTGIQITLQQCDILWRIRKILNAVGCPLAIAEPATDFHEVILPVTQIYLLTGEVQRTDKQAGQVYYKHLLLHSKCLDLTRMHRFYSFVFNVRTGILLKTIRKSLYQLHGG